jgi:hypothetical protein
MNMSSGYGGTVVTPGLIWQAVTLPRCLERLLTYPGVDSAQGQSSEISSAKGDTSW